MRAFSLALGFSLIFLLFLFGCVGEERKEVQELTVYEGVGIPIKGNPRIEVGGEKVIYGGVEIEAEIIGRGKEVEFDGEVYRGVVYDKPGGEKIGEGEVIIAKLSFSKSEEEGIEILKVNKSSVFWTLLLIPAKKEVSLESITAYVKAGNKLYRPFKLYLRGGECLKNVSEVEGREEAYCLFVVPEKAKALVVSPYGINPNAYMLFEKPI